LSSYLPPLVAESPAQPLELSTAAAGWLADFRTYYRRRTGSEESVKLRTTHVKDFLKRVDDLAAVTEDDVYDWLDAHTPGWSDATKQSAVSSVREFFKYARRKGLMSFDFADDMPRIRNARRESRMIDEDTLMGALKTAPLAERTMILLGAECGLRVSEIATLRLSDREGDWLHVLGKGHKIRKVFVTPELGRNLDLLASRSRNGYYFPGDRTDHLHQSTVWRRVRDLTGFNTHSLRHRAGTIVYQRGGNDIRLAQMFLGHSSPNTTAVYVHVGDEDLRRAAAATRMAPVTELTAADILEMPSIGATV
jgi:integrase